MVERFNRRIGEALAAKARIADNGGKNCLGHKAPAELLHDLAKSYTQAGISPMSKSAEIPACAGMTGERGLR